MHLDGDLPPPSQLGIHDLHMKALRMAQSHVGGFCSWYRHHQRRKTFLKVYSVVGVDLQNFVDFVESLKTGGRDCYEIIHGWLLFRSWES